MNEKLLLHGVKGSRIHMVGIKGVGMTALAEILAAQGARLSGSDTAEIFFTDAILRKLNVKVNEGFDQNNIEDHTDLVIYSAAYSPSQHPELVTAAKKNIPALSYPEALGALSSLYDSAGIAGVHGKTTTTAMAGTLIKELRLPATILVGSEVPNFGNCSTYIGGDTYFIAETCEYKRHFLHFHLSRLVITSIEEDHLDYYKNLEDIYDAFEAYALNLKKNGALIFCSDDIGAREIVRRVKDKRHDLLYIPYGFAAQGSYLIADAVCGQGITRFSLAGFKNKFVLHIPGKHSILNAAAALALVFDIAKSEKVTIDEAILARAGKALESFTGTRRRSELLGEANGILFMDDYAHHPTAIQKTLAGIRAYYPGRRLVVDFMSHTHSRTQALLAQFANSFAEADEVILHKIYASAREKPDGKISGETLFLETQKHHQSVRYFQEAADAFPYLAGHLARGDLFITMGAGDNWKLSHNLFRHFQTSNRNKEILYDRSRM